MNQAGHVLLYAVAAAASPLVLVATFEVLRSERPRANGIAFLSGLVLGTCIACGLGLLLGNAMVKRIDSHGTIEAVLTLLLGMVLLVFGLRARHSSPRPETEGSSRASAMLAGLDTAATARSILRAEWRSPPKLLRAVVARLLGAEGLAKRSQEDTGLRYMPTTLVSSVACGEA